MPLYYHAIYNPLTSDGNTAPDESPNINGANDRIVEIDGAAVYNMLVKLRRQPEIAHRVLDFKPTCYQGGCGMKDAAFDRGYYDDKESALDIARAR